MVPMNDLLNDIEPSVNGLLKNVMKKKHTISFAMCNGSLCVVVIYIVQCFDTEMDFLNHELLHVNLIIFWFFFCNYTCGNRFQFTLTFFLEGKIAI